MGVRSMMTKLSYGQYRLNVVKKRLSQDAFRFYDLVSDFYTRCERRCGARLQGVLLGLAALT